MLHINVSFTQSHKSDTYISRRKILQNIWQIGK